MRGGHKSSLNTQENQTWKQKGNTMETNVTQSSVIWRKGKRVILRPFEEADLPYFQRWINDLDNNQHLRKVTSPIFSINGRSKRYAEKCGYRHMATIEGEHFRNGKWIDKELFVVFRDEWWPI